MERGLGTSGLLAERSQEKVFDVVSIGGGDRGAE